MNSTVRGHKAWWGLLAMCLSVLNAPAFAANPAANLSTLFAFDLHTVSGGVVEGLDGMLYGTTSDTSLTHGGTVYKVAKTGGAPQVVYQLGENDGYSPQATLLAGRNSAGPDGYLYGTTYYDRRTPFSLTSGSGTVFRVAQDGSSYTTLHTFAQPSGVNSVTGNLTNADGMRSTQALIQDDTYLYGVTPSGGLNGSGTVFRVRKSDGVTDVLYTFKAPATSGVGGDGEGAFPSSSLTLSLNDGRLYGVTYGGGTNLKTTAGATAETNVTVGTGTIYRLNIDGSGFTTLHSFSALDDTAATSPGVNADGAQPIGALLELEGQPGVFIGTTTDGGTTAATGFGTVFRFDAVSAQVTTLYNFDSTTGATPVGNLILDQASGLVYGAVTAGGGNGAGGIYAVDPNTPTTGDQTTRAPMKHSLTFAEGGNTTGSLLKASDGDVYTTVQSGNACTALNGAGYGAVLRYSLTTGGSSAAYSSCTQPSNSGGGAMSPGFVLLLAMLGLVPPLRRRLLHIR